MFKRIFYVAIFMLGVVVLCLGVAEHSEAKVIDNGYSYSSSYGKYLTVKVFSSNSNVVKVVRMKNGVKTLDYQMIKSNGKKVTCTYIGTNFQLKKSYKTKASARKFYRTYKSGFFNSFM